MGNYTWIIKCVSNISVDEPSIDIIEFLSRQYANRDWWFDEWLDSLSESHSQLVKKSTDLPRESFKETLLNDPTFPRKISMKDSMHIFNEKEFYGYIGHELKQFLKDFGRCLPENTFMMMLGIYEGFGPVALGWNNNGKFVSMMGFENRSICHPSILEMSLEKYLNEYYCDTDQHNESKNTHRRAMLFKEEVLDSVDHVNWTYNDIVSWLERRGFEKEGPATIAKYYGMTGCNQQ